MRVYLLFSLFITLIACMGVTRGDQFDSFFEESPLVVVDDVAVENQDYQVVQSNQYPSSYDSTIIVLPKGVDIFESALESYSAASEAEVKVADAKLDLKITEQEYNTNVSWDTDIGLIHSKARDHKVAKTKNDTNAAIKTSINLSKTLWDPELNYAIESSQQAVQTADILHFGERQELIESVAIAYLEYLSLKDMAIIALRRKNLFVELKNQVQKRKDLGYAANIDISEVVIQLQSAIVEQKEAQAQLHKAQINLSKLTGNQRQMVGTNHTFFRGRNDIKLSSTKYLINTALENNTELQVLRSTQVSLLKDIQSKRAAGDLKVGLASSLSQSWKHGDVDQESIDFSFGVSLKMPLYTGGRVKNGIEKAKLGLLQSERLTNKKKKEIIAKLNTLSITFSGTLSSYKSLLELRNQMSKNIQLIRTAVTYGVRENGGIYNALDSKFKLENSLTRQYYELLKTKVKIMKLTGELDSSNLNQLRSLLSSQRNHLG